MSDEESADGLLRALADEERRLKQLAEWAMAAVDSDDPEVLERAIGCAPSEAKEMLEKLRPPNSDRRESWLLIWTLLARFPTRR